jgi:eukaryotic-like serine/threonine-protein kinase
MARLLRRRLPLCKINGMQAPYSPTPARLGPYELLQKLATGGMAEIYIAEIYIARREGPHGFSKRIALKRILPQLAADPEFVAMFIDEARLCAQLTHPNLVQVFDFGEEAGELYMAMELIEGTTAAKVARAAASRGEPVPTEVALHIALSVARGLAHAHEASDDEGRPLGLVHRDVSPGNILISGSGAVKLGDFGIARAAEFERRTDQGQLKGKLGYMSPEQVTGRELDAKSDQFTAAIVLAELLTARPLFSGPREMDVLVKIRDADISVLERYGRHIPSDLMGVLKRALARRRDDRFPTTGAYVDALEEVVRRRRLGATPATLAEWLLRVALVKPTGKSGEHVISALAPERGAPRADGVKAPEGDAPPIKPSGAQPLWKRRTAADAQPTAPSDPQRAVYRLARPDLSSPLSLHELINLLTAGRITVDTSVSRDDGPFRALRDLPELTILTTASGASMADTDGGAMKLATSFRMGELPGRLFDLVVRRSTGMLLVRQGQLEKKAYFNDGVPDLTSSSDEKELLGSLLISRGLALPMEVEMGLALAPRYGGRLGDALVGLGVLRPVELVRAVVDQMRRRFVELVGWKRGQLTFTAGAVSRDEDSMPEALNGVELIARGIIEGYSYDDLSAVLAPLQSAIILPVTRAPVAIASLKLPSRENAVLDAITGHQSLAQLASEAVLRGMADREGTLRAVFIGLSCGAFIAQGWPPVVPRESLPTVPVA